MLKPDQRQLSFIRPITWQEIFHSWQNDEAHQQRWIAHYKSRGFNTWNEWRNRHVAPLKLDERDWFLYRINNPLKTIPHFFGGPFKAWKKEHYGKHDALSFADLATSPKIITNPVINKLVDNFPSPTMLIGLWQKNRIVIGEGMHRCCAVALAAQRGLLIKPEVNIALADFSKDEIPLLEQIKKQ